MKKKNCENTTVIFQCADRNRTEIYEMNGCEKVLKVRALINDTTGNPYNYTLIVFSISKNDAHLRPTQVMNITSQNMNMPIDSMWGSCGDMLQFQLSDVDAESHVFLEIEYETCIPQACCDCKKK